MTPCPRATMGWREPPSSPTSHQPDTLHPTLSLRPFKQAHVIRATSHKNNTITYKYTQSSAQYTLLCNTHHIGPTLHHTHSIIDSHYTQQNITHATLTQHIPLTSQTILRQHTTSTYETQSTYYMFTYTTHPLTTIIGSNMEVVPTSGHQIPIHTQ